MFWPFLQSRAAADIAMLKNETGGKLSGEMLLLLTLVIEDGYLLFPSTGERKAIAARSALFP